jgi:hypothetical protein
MSCVRVCGVAEGKVVLVLLACSALASPGYAWGVLRVQRQELHACACTLAARAVACMPASLAAGTTQCRVHVHQRPLLLPLLLHL